MSFDTAEVWLLGSTPHLVLTSRDISNLCVSAGLRWVKFLHPINLSADAIIQIRPSQTKLEMFSGYQCSQVALQLPRRKRGRKIRKPHICSLGGFSITCGSGLEHLWEGVIICRAFLEVESGLRQLPGDRVWDGTFHPTLTSFEYSA